MEPITLKPITLYWTTITPNPSKVLIIIEELGLPYEGKYIPMDQLKEPAYEAINPNGKLPALHDPNTKITLWETGAIIAYLVETYDKEDKITYHSSPGKFLLQQWSFFQASGQGPYFGQAAWFNRFHSEPLPSAKERYGNELKRIVGVLNNVLKGRDWLVGDKCTYADLAFCMWNNSIGFALQGGPTEWNIDEFPEFKRWQEAMMARKSVQKVLSVLQSTEISGKGTL